MILCVEQREFWHWATVNFRGELFHGKGQFYCQRQLSQSRVGGVRQVNELACDSTRPSMQLECCNSPVGLLYRHGGFSATLLDHRLPLNRWRWQWIWLACSIGPSSSRRRSPSVLIIVPIMTITGFWMHGDRPAMASGLTYFAGPALFLAACLLSCLNVVRRTPRYAQSGISRPEFRIRQAFGMPQRMKR